MKKCYIIETLIVISVCSACSHPPDPNKSSTSWLDTIKVVEMAPIKEDEPIPKSDSAALFSAWKNIMTALQEKDLKLLLNYSFDSVYCQACISFPKGTNVEDVPVRHLQSKSFLKFYSDSFLFPKLVRYISDQNNIITDYFVFQIKKPAGFSNLPGDSITVYRIRFQEFNRYSLGYYFITFNGQFKFLGLYL